MNKIEYLDYGLHRFPKKLNAAIQEKIDSIREPHLIVLGYGLCGNGLDGIRAGVHTLLISRSDDCIGILMGSYEDYLREFYETPGTYYLTKGWLESGSNPLSEYEEYVEKYGIKKAEYLMDVQYKNYQRLAFIAHRSSDHDQYREKAKTVAKFCERWKMRYEEILGSEQYIRRLALTSAALDTAGEDFIVVSPGGQLKQSDFIRM